MRYTIYWVDGTTTEFNAESSDEGESFVDFFDADEEIKLSANISQIKYIKYG